MGLQKAAKNSLGRLNVLPDLGQKFLADDDEFSREKGQTILDVIPTEVLGGYTAILAVIVASDAGAWKAGRWIMYGIAAALVPLAILVISQRAARARGKKPVLPIYEMIGATTAFGAWGLIMPGAPLTYTLSGSDLTIWTVILTIVAAFVLFALPLNRPGADPAYD